MSKKVILPETVRTNAMKEDTFLGRSSVKVIGVSTNAEALAVHRREKADLIVAMLDSAGMPGEDLCSIIRDDPALRSVSIIIVGSGQETDEERCLGCRANSFVSHIEDSATLLEEAHQLLHVPPRVDHRVPVRIRIEGLHRRKSFEGMTENVSAAGMLLRSSVELDEGDAIECSLTLPRKTRIRANGEVVRVIGSPNDDGLQSYGIRFIDIDTDAEAVLESYLRQSTL